MMMTVQDIDLSGLNKFVYDLHRALHGTGQGGDLNKLLATEAGQLAWETAEQLGPSSRSGANKQIEKDVARYLTKKPAYLNLSAEQQESSYADFAWLCAGKNYLLGINNEDNRRDASVDEALKIYYGGAKAGSRGKRYIELGTRNAKGGKHQHILRLNRTRVSAATFSAVRATIKDRVGQLKASFAYSASRLVPFKRIPDWVRRQFPAVVANGKAIFDDSRLNDATSPSITIGSRAKGVESNPYIQQKFANAVERRKYIIADKLKKIFSDYTYNWKTGQVFRTRE